MGEDFRDLNNQVMAELSACMAAIDEREAERVVKSLTGARKVFAVGVGRVMLVLQAFVKRLNHLGIEAYHVGAIGEPAISDQDVLLIASGSGESAVPVVIGKVAQKYRPTIIYVGSNMNSTAAGMADICLRIPCRTKLNLEGELNSQQPMSSLFEQSLLIVLDTLTYMIVQKKNLVMDDLWQKHANLE